MPSKREIEAREKLVLYLSRLIFGDDYDEAIGRAKSLAREEDLWKQPSKKEGE